MKIFARFGDGYDCLDYLVEGWSGPESGFVWSNGRRSIVSLPRPESIGAAVLTVRVRPYRPQVQPFQMFSVMVNGSVVGECIVRDETVLEFFLTASLVAKYDLLDIVFYFYAPLRPCDIDDSDDRRLLSLALIEIRVSELLDAGHHDLVGENLLSAPESVLGILADQRSDDARWTNRIVDPTRVGGLRPSLLIEGYLRGAGATAQIRPRITDAIGSVLGTVQQDAVAKPVVLDADGQLTTELVEQHASPFSEFLFEYEDQEQLTIEEVLPGGRNQALLADFPFPFGSGLIRAERPATLAYSSRNATAYVHPYHYAIYQTETNRLWRRANPQGLSKFILSEKKITVDQDVVILQDQFDGGNFAHFLFDSVTRMFHFVNLESSNPEQALFIFGGVPRSFHKLILAAAADDLGLKEKQLFFPRSAWNIRTTRSVFLFSDQMEYFHPAQMMHPRSVAALKRLGQKLPVESDAAGRIYVSRSDAWLRRVSNEQELVGALEKLGFVSVCLSELPILNQIRLVANASVIVAPHGMGLTHLAFHRGQPTVVELFNPVIGSDDYAFLSRAFGFDYYAIAGRQTDAQTVDFAVDVDQVVAVLRTAGVIGA